MSVSSGWTGAAPVLVVVLAVVLIEGCGPNGKATNPGGDAAASDLGAQPGDLGDTIAASDASDATGVAADAPRDLVSEAPASATAASVCREAIETQCRRHLACYGYATETCTSVAALCPDYYFNDSSNRTVAGVQACLPALAQMTCTDVAMLITPACLTVPGKAAVGSPCLHTTECQTYCNSPVLNSCGVCNQGTRVGPGQACGTTQFCNPADYCHEGTKTCASKASIVYAAQGQPCDFLAVPSVGCAGDLMCARPSETVTGGTCRPVPKVGEPCLMNGFPGNPSVCGPGLRCEQMVCRPVDVCGDAGMCDPSRFCRTFNGISTCVLLAAEGQPCRLLSPELPCVANLRCTMALEGNQDGVCVKPAGQGDGCRDPAEPCGGNLMCVDSICRMLNPASCKAGPVDAGGG